MADHPMIETLKLRVEALELVNEALRAKAHAIELRIAQIEKALVTLSEGNWEPLKP